MSEIVLSATIPVRLPAEEELAAVARSVLPLRQARALADWLGNTPVDHAEGFRSPRARLDAALSLGIITGDGVVTSEITGRLDWLYEVGYHAGYIHAENHFQLLHRNEDLPASDGSGSLDDRTDADVLADWEGALEALYAHGLDHVIPAGVNPKPLDFHGNGVYPLLKLLQLGGIAPVDVLAGAVAAAVTDGLPASYGRTQWAAWVAKHGDPTRAFLELTAELGALTLDGTTVTLAPLSTRFLVGEAKVGVEQLPAPADMTADQVILCRLGMGDEAFGRELDGWLAAREPAGGVRDLLAVAAEMKPGDYGYLMTALRVAADIEGDTEAVWQEAATASSLVRPHAIAELSRRAGRDPWRDPLPGLEFLDRDAVVMAS
jgi:hypothetical protein